MLTLYSILHTAMATLVARNGYDVVMLTRRVEVCSCINEEHRNPTHLTEFALPENIRATLDPSEALAGTVAVIHAIPLQSSEDFLLKVCRTVFSRAHRVTTPCYVCSLLHRATPPLDTTPTPLLRHSYTTHTPLLRHSYATPRC